MTDFRSKETGETFADLIHFYLTKAKFVIHFLNIDDREYKMKLKKWWAELQPEAKASYDWNWNVIEKEIKGL